MPQQKVHYPTPSTSAVYIGEFHVDDAYQVEWEMRDTTSPLHTYFAPEFVNIARGKKIVTGSMAINFRYVGYLAAALREVRQRMYKPEDIRQQSRDGGHYVTNYLNEMRTGDPVARLNLLIDAARRGPDALRKMSALAYYAQIGPGIAQNLSGDYSVPVQDVFEAQNPWENQVKGVDIWTHYGDTREIHSADILKDVVFTGKSKQVAAGASPSGGLSASGINILEVYSFFAKSVEQVRVDPTAVGLQTVETGPQPTNTGLYQIPVQQSGNYASGNPSDV